MKKAVFLMGPTASGKTALALDLLKRFPFEIISVDSAQVFREMDLGTAKPDPDILKQAPHHLIDIIDPTETYSAGKFRADAARIMEDIFSREKIPLLVGGTMLYFKALKEGLNDLPRADQEIREKIEREAEKSGWPSVHARLAEIDAATAKRLDPNDAQRIQRAMEVWMLTGIPLSRILSEKKPEAPSVMYGEIALVPSDRAILHRRIAERFASMVDSGLASEVEKLRKEYPLDLSMPSMRSVGYRQAWQYLDGEYGNKEFLEKGIAATRQLAKRQLTWIRSMEEAALFDCLDGNLNNKVENHVKNFLGAALHSRASLLR